MAGRFRLTPSSSKLAAPHIPAGTQGRSWPVELQALLASPRVAAALQNFYRDRPALNELHLDLCRVAAPTFFEQKRAEWMCARFRSLGLECRLDKVGNVVAHAPGARGPFIAVTAHLDTVLAPRTPEDIRLGADGRFLGPGVADNGAGLVALVAMAKAWLDASSPTAPAQPLFVANIGEEGEGNLSGMRYLCDSPLASQIRAFLVLDGPTADHITCQALASRRFEIILTGAGGHSWSDQGTGNPSHALTRAMAHFVDHPTVLDAVDHRCSVNVGVLEGGSSVTSIPTLARAKVDLRSENVARLAELAFLLQATVERAVETENLRARHGRVQASLKEIGSRPGGRLDPASPLLSALHTVEGHLRIQSQLDCASTDANVPLSLGLPAVSIGAGGAGGGAHTPHEWYSPDGRETGLKRILLTLLLLCGAGGV